ncbi:MAG: nitrite/sulfite reductase [Polyangiales bacterium]
MHEEIDVFERQLTAMRAGEMDAKLFIETRLRRGAYGQRYDNGQRHNGQASQKLDFPCGDAIKGPETVWDAPGMQRIKIPYGKMTADQLDTLAACAEEYSDAILHVTTRQDIQLHFVHIEDTPDMMRRLAAVGITTREACGNSVRNVTACPLAGVCHEETFDITPYAHAFTYYFLGHPDVQDFGRKFKVAFSGCKHNPCGLVTFHDLGAIARMREVDGKRERGFELFVGGGLGSVPQEAKCLAEFVPEAELLPMSQAVCRVFARLGEKKNRSRARVKFLVKQLGIEEFRRLVEAERATLRPDPGWTAFLSDVHSTDETPLRLGSPFDPNANDLPAEIVRWADTNLRPQRQAGYYVAAITLPLGDFTSHQARALAELTRRFTGDTLRTTVDQNLALRWLSGADVPEFYRELARIGLAEAGADTISDVTACPGTDTCKLGISSSRGLSAELRKHLRVVHDADFDANKRAALRGLHVKTSGCFNACGQHHAADIGFLGVSRNVGGRRVPHFQMVLGGQWTHNAASYGLAIGAIPSKNVPAALQRITERYVAERQAEESFQAFIRRIGKASVRQSLADLMKTPGYDDDRSYYSDWGDPREYTIGDIGIGECAGEVVPFVEFGLEAGEREAFEAQTLLDQGKATQAAAQAFRAMLTVAQALVRHADVQVGDSAEDIMAQFRTHFHDTKRFHDPFAGAKFANYFLRLQDKDVSIIRDSEAAHQRIEEAQLFIEAAHSCYQRMSQQGVATAD